LQAGGGHPYRLGVDDDQDVRRIEEALGELVRVASSRRLHAARMTRVDLSLSRGEARCLAYLVDTGPRSAAELAGALDLGPATARRALAALERQGLAGRDPEAAAARPVRYAASPQGRRAHRRIRRLRHDQLTAALDGLSSRRRHELVVGLEDLVERLRSRGPDA